MKNSSVLGFMPRMLLLIFCSIEFRLSFCCVEILAVLSCIMTFWSVVVSVRCIKGIDFGFLRLLGTMVNFRSLLSLSELAFSANVRVRVLGVSSIILTGGSLSVAVRMGLESVWVFPLFLVFS